MEWAQILGVIKLEQVCSCISECLRVMMRVHVRLGECIRQSVCELKKKKDVFFNEFVCAK